MHLLSPFLLLYSPRHLRSPNGKFPKGRGDQSRAFAVSGHGCRMSRSDCSGVRRISRFFSPSLFSLGIWRVLRLSRFFYPFGRWLDEGFGTLWAVSKSSWVLNDSETHNFRKEFAVKTGNFINSWHIITYIKLPICLPTTWKRWFCCHECLLMFRFI